MAFGTGPSDIELVIRFIIGLFLIYACVYAVRSTKLAYWKQCWYIILLGCLIHTIYIVVALTMVAFAETPCIGTPCAGLLRNLGMGIVAIGILMLAKRTKDIMG